MQALEIKNFAFFFFFLQVMSTTIFSFVDFVELLTNLWKRRSELVHFRVINNFHDVS